MLANYNFASFLWDLIVFTAFFMFIWLVIMAFMDIFHRRDLSGWGKALWTIFIIVLPFIGVLTYLIVRPHTKQDDEDMERAMKMQAVAQGAAVVSSADEIDKLNRLKASGAISDEEYATLKAKAIAG